MSNVCITCGTIIPEGRIVCPICEHDLKKSNKEVTESKTVFKEVKEFEPAIQKLTQPLVYHEGRFWFNIRSVYDLSSLSNQYLLRDLETGVQKVVNNLNDEDFKYVSIVEIDPNYITVVKNYTTRGDNDGDVR